MASPIVPAPSRVTVPPLFRAPGTAIVAALVFGVVRTGAALGSPVGDERLRRALGAG